MRERRGYVVWLNPDEVVNLFRMADPANDFIMVPSLQQGRDEAGGVVKIPPDVSVTDATYDWYRRQIGLRITHPSFPVVKDGDYWPSLTSAQWELRSKRVVREGGEMILVDAPEPDAKGG